MSNLFFNIPAPAGNGVGAPVDIRTMGACKTITVQGEYRGTVQIEISLDEGATWAQVPAFFDSGKKGPELLRFSSQFVRMRRSGVPQINPGLPNAEVSGTDDGAMFANLPGDGSSVNTEALGCEKTITVQNLVQGGTINIQVSDDEVNWATCMTFKASGVKYRDFIAKFMRSDGSNAAVNVGAANDPGSGAMDELVKVTGDDDNSGFLADKVVAGDGISLVVLNPGGDEDLEISADDEFVKVSAADTNNDFLANKVVAGDGISLAIVNPGADEDLEITVEDADAGNIVTGAPITVTGDTNAEGVGDEIARAKHQHRLELEVEDEGALAGARPTINFVGIGVGAVDDIPNDRVNITIPGTPSDGTVVKRSLYKDDEVDTSGNVFIDGMSGSSISVPIDGDYCAIYEGEAENSNANAVMEIGISVNSTVAVVANSERDSQGPAADFRWIGTSVDLGTLTAGDLVRMLFRKKSGALDVKVKRRNLMIIKVQ